MTGRPPRPKPTPAELEARIVEALRAAGGSSQRNNLRAVIRPVMTTADFDRAIAALIARGAIKAKLVTLTWRSHRDMDLPYHVTVYALSQGRRGRPSPGVEVATGPKRDPDGRSRKPAPSVVETENDILNALREAGGSKGRTALRSGITPRVPLEAFDAAIASLIRRRMIKANEIKPGESGDEGKVVKRPMTLYILTSAGTKSR